MGIIEDFTSSYKGRILISIIWGLGLATLFRRVCKGRDCIVIKSVDPDEIKNKIYKYDDKCYSFDAKITRCKN